MNPVLPVVPVDPVLPGRPVAPGFPAVPEKPKAPKKKLFLIHESKSAYNSSKMKLITCNFDAVPVFVRTRITREQGNFKKGIGNLPRALLP